MSIQQRSQFNGTRFMSTGQYNQLPATARRQENGKCYVFNGTWQRVQFTKKAA